MSLRTAPPSSTDEAVLFERWQQHADEQARDALVERYVPLARKLALRYVRSSEPLEDLVQVASLGLVKALSRFEVDRSNRFVTFAVPTILGELRRYFRDAGWAVHVPRGTQERALQVERAERELTGRHGRSPTVAELAQYTELDIEVVLEALQAAHAYDTLSLDAPGAAAMVRWSRWWSPSGTRMPVTSSWSRGRRWPPDFVCCPRVNARSSTFASCMS